MNSLFVLVFSFLNLFQVLINGQAKETQVTLSGEEIKRKVIELEKGRVIGKAELLVKEKPVTVTASSCTRSAGSRHDFFSEGPYWWPDPSNPDGPFVRKDGLRNQENFKDHDRALIRFSDIVATNTTAYLLTGDEKYVRAAMDHLNAWFVDTVTRMNPNMLYAQAITGICTGRGIGIIDANPLIDVARSVSILEKSPYAPGTEIYKVKDWFRQFLKWLTTHPYGLDEINAKNNHGSWCLAQVATYAGLVGDQEMVQSCRKRFREIILHEQMAADGSFPLELERTKPYSYSLFNLDALAFSAWILSDRNNDLWKFKTKDGKGLSLGLEYMLPYINDISKWPYPKDISDWETQPGKRNFMIYAAVANSDDKWLRLWESLGKKRPGEILSEERNHLLLWLDLKDPLCSKVYENPIIPGFNPDPSICRSGEDFYLVTSSFEYFPGVPVYHSPDLVNWEMVGHVLSRPSQHNLDSVPCSGGIYAPTIRVHNGTWYMITTFSGTRKGYQRGNFIATAKKPEGPWSDPHWIKDAPGIDPSLFFDDDGKAYYCGNITPEKKVWDKHRNIWVQEIDLRNFVLTGKRVEVLDGAEYYKKGTLDGGIENGVNNYESPHIYKKNGFYYLMIAHGGTSQNHAVSMWRSRNIFGPYEINPANPILSHRDLSVEYPMTSTGHADLAEAQNGSWWMVFLAKRPYGGENHILGRETFLVPVDWKGDWPIVNPDGEKGRASVVHFRPGFSNGKIPDCCNKDDFTSPALGKNWTFIRTPWTEWWSLSRNKGFLAIDLRPEMISDLANPSFIGTRQADINCKCSVKMEFEPKVLNEEAGLVVERDRENYFKFTVTRNEKGLLVRLVSRSIANGKDEIVATAEIRQGTKFLKITSEGVLYTFRWSEDGETWNSLAENMDGRFLGTAGAGRFTGTLTGMYASSNGKESTNRAFFDWYEY
jgi:xylan 1,4-beta-xylosidase